MIVGGFDTATFYSLNEGVGVGGTFGEVSQAHELAKLIGPNERGKTVYYRGKHQQTLRNHGINNILLQKHFPSEEEKEVVSSNHYS